MSLLLTFNVPVTTALDGKVKPASEFILLAICARALIAAKSSSGVVAAKPSTILFLFFKVFNSSKIYLFCCLSASNSSVIFFE